MCSFFVQFSILGCFFLFFNPTSWSQNWEFVGPSEIRSSGIGVINRVLCHPDGRVFASSPDGGLWHCNSFQTNNWVPISDHLENLEVRAFDVSRQSSNVIYLGLNRSILYKTTSRGATWEKLEVVQKFGEITVIKVDPANSDVLYLGTTRGLLRSRNGGNSFDTLLLDKDITDLEIDPSNSSILLVGARFEGVHRSVNGGQTWIRVLNSPITQGTQPSKIVIALGTRNPNGSLQTINNRTVVVKIGTGVYKSEQNGSINSFTQLVGSLLDGLPSESGGGSSLRTNGIRKEWNNDVGINPFNSRHFSVGQSGFFITENGGTTFRTQGTGHEDIQSIAYSPVDSTVLFIGNDGGVFKSTNKGLNFSSFYSNLSVSQLIRAAINRNTIIVNSDHNGVIGTPNFLTSRTWIRAASRECTYANDSLKAACGYGNNAMEKNGVYLDPHNRNRYFIFAAPLSRFTFPRSNSSRCNGDLLPIATFTPYKPLVFPNNPQGGITTTRAPFILFPLISRSFIWVGHDVNATGNFGLMYTREGRKNPTGTDRCDVENLPIWRQGFTSGNDPVVDIEVHTRTQTVCAITASGKLYTVRSRFFYRNNWNEHPSIDPIPAIIDMSVAPDNARKIYAISENAVHISDTQGDTWTSTLRNETIAVHAYFSILCIADGLIFVSTSDGVYKSTNDGQTWEKLEGSLPNVKVTQLKLSGDFIYAITYGRGIWRIPLATVR